MYAVNGQWSLGQTETNSWKTTRVPSSEGLTSFTHDTMIISYFWTCTIILPWRCFKCITPEDDAERLGMRYGAREVRKRVKGYSHRSSFIRNVWFSAELHGLVSPAESCMCIALHTQCVCVLFGYSYCYFMSFVK